MYKQILFILVTAIMLVGCEAKKEIKSDLEKMNLKGKISKVIIATNTAEVNNGLVDAVKTSTDKNYYNHIIKFNDDGNIISYRSLNYKRKRVKEIHYEYDNNKRLISEVYLNADDNIDKRKVYEYEGENLICIRTEDRYTNELGREEFKYDGDKVVKKEKYRNGVLVSSDTLLSNDENYEAWEHSDENGITNHEFIYENGALKEAIFGDMSYLFERDEKGNITKAYNASASPEGFEIFDCKSKEGVHIYKYKYDKRGNWKSRIEHYSEKGRAKFLVSRKIFYEDGDDK